MIILVYSQKLLPTNMFVCLFQGLGGWMPVAWQIESVFAEIPRVQPSKDGLCLGFPFPRPLHQKTPLREEVLWAQDFNKSFFLLHLALAPDHWLARNVGCLKMPVVAQAFGYLTRVNLLGCSASDTSPPGRMVSLVWVGWIQWERILNSKMVS